MNKAPEKSEPASRERVPVEADETLDLAALRQRITSLVCAEAMEMVEATIAQVQKGHYQALKYLFEMIGLYPVAGAQEAPPEDSLANTLLRHLGISEEEIGISANRSSAPGLMSQGDAVK